MVAKEKRGRVWKATRKNERGRPNDARQNRGRLVFERDILRLE